MEGGRRCQEIALHVFGFRQHEPRIVDKGVVFLALEIFLVFLVVRLARLFRGLFLDGVEGDGLLHLFYRAVETARRLWRFG